VFEELSISVFGIQVQKKAFEKGGKGTQGSWDLKYMDSDLRVLRTNAGVWLRDTWVIWTRCRHMPWVSMNLDVMSTLKYVDL